ncbi:MAG: hypothetical protein CFH33_00152 [Alphaproteobacteria bacterium MarineAlpha9_Bin3]|nr:MAG: hypothetical protein CFH33_00152 [Alphaproteobacteria bacterium MarineAlpha9_Bin3]|tara:strand:+ start:8361 stop:9356 length:996 start_codon:yes stop_codon:yes gene_type:complete
MNNKNKENTIWLLLDDRAGNCSQVLGIEKALNLKCSKKKIQYNSLSKLPNIFLQNSIRHIKFSDRKQFKAPWPKIIIGCGRKSAPIGLWIKKQSNNYSKYIQIMWPSYPYKNIDLIFTPLHDEIKNKDNVIEIQTSPNIINKKFTFESYNKWNNKFGSLIAPKISVIIGGDTKKHKLKINHIRDLFKNINNILNDKGSIMISSSRRTSKESLIQIKKEIKKLKFKTILWNVNDNTPNPYHGFLAHGDLVIVTGDSVSICSEVCSTGKPLLIFAPKDITIKKHNKFHKLLIKKGIAKYLENFKIKDLKNFNYKPIYESENIARIIKNKYLNK